MREQPEVPDYDSAVMPSFPKKNVRSSVPCAWISPRCAGTPRISRVGPPDVVGCVHAEAAGDRADTLPPAPRGKGLQTPQKRRPIRQLPRITYVRPGDCALTNMNRPQCEKHAPANSLSLSTLRATS
jgi:hypothetical protein